MDDQLKNKAEQIKGRAKEAAGIAVDDDGLKAEGQADQRKADIKGKIGRLKDKLQTKVDEVL